MVGESGLVVGILGTPADIMAGSVRLVSVTLPSTCRIELCAVTGGAGGEDSCGNGCIMVRVGEVLLQLVLERWSQGCTSGRIALG